MTHRNPKKIAIIGAPGSGKSTFANKLSQKLKIPVYHLDDFIFDENGVKRDKSELIPINKRLVTQEYWIIEGCSISTLDLRFEKADILIYLNLSTSICILNVFKRMFSRSRQLEKTGCLKNVNWILLKYILNFKKNKDPIIKTVKEKYHSTVFVELHNRNEIERFMNYISSSENELFSNPSKLNYWNL